jgi:proline dehydrogenase
VKAALWARLRDARYALPGWVERHIAGPDAQAAARIAARLEQRGVAATLGYFQANAATPETIEAANLSALATMAGHHVYLSVKSPPLGHDPARIARIADAARLAGTAILFDAHAPKDAAPTLALVGQLLPDHPGTGCVIPARWGRSAADVAQLRDSTARIRLVKGEWADPDWSGDIEAAYLALVRQLAGRAAPVAIATHHPPLAEAALALLRQAGTPCELEQLRGLPARRTMRIAARLGVPVRVYVPFGPGWWPYALDKALARPWLPLWAAKDFIARPSTSPDR